MTLSESYDFENFEPGWRKLHTYQKAADPRDVSEWLGDVWTVIPPRIEVTSQPPESSEALVELESFATELTTQYPVRSFHLFDKRLQYVLGYPMGRLFDRFRFVIARAYEAADHLASQIAFERDLLARCRPTAEAITNARYSNRRRESIEDGLYLLGELNMNEDPNSDSMIPDSTSELTPYEIAQQLNNIHKNYVTRGRKPDIALQFFLLRLAEGITLTTGITPTLSYKPVTPAGGVVPSLNKWQKFVELTLKLVNLPVQPETLDHPLRTIGNDVVFRHVLGYLDDPGSLGTMRRQHTVGFGDLPSHGIQIDYFCRLFYHRDRYPPKRRTIDEMFPDMTA